MHDWNWVTNLDRVRGQLTYSGNLGRVSTILNKNAIEKKKYKLSENQALSGSCVLSYTS